MNSKDKIAVIEAQDRGEKVEVRTKPAFLGDCDYYQAPDWTCHGAPYDFNFSAYDYRVAPKFTPEQQKVIDAYNRGEEIEISAIENPYGTGWLSGSCRSLVEAQGFGYLFKNFHVRIKPSAPREFLFEKGRLVEMVNTRFGQLMKYPERNERIKLIEAPESGQ